MMNFWEFKEDHSRGYWIPADNSTAYHQGGALVRGLFFWIILLFKAAALIIKGLGYLLYMLFLLIRKLKNNALPTYISATH